MQNKIRGFLVFSSLLTIVLGATLVAAFVLICFDGMINDFAYFGVLANFNEVLGVIGLACLMFGLVCLKLGASQFRLARLKVEAYKKSKFKLVCSLIVYVALMIVGAFCLFETYNDISAVGQSFLQAGIGYVGLGILVASAIAFVLVIIDLYAFNHDLKNGVIEPEAPLLLNAPQCRLLYHNSEKLVDYSKLDAKIQKLQELKSKGILTQEEYDDLKRQLFDTFL